MDSRILVTSWIFLFVILSLDASVLGGGVFSVDYRISRFENILATHGIYETEVIWESVPGSGGLLVGDRPREGKGTRIYLGVFFLLLQ